MRRINTLIEINIYEVEFTYMTIHGNWKKQRWEVPALTEKEAAGKLKSFLRNYNADNEDRAYLNIEILSTIFRKVELLEA